jgi:tetratricopeptide (TPR) repeat protein
MSAVILASALAVMAPVLRDAWDAKEIGDTRIVHPQAVDLLEKGEGLAMKGAVQDAEKVFREGEAIDPESSLLWRRDCEALTVLGRKEEAIAACQRAIENARTGTNYRALVRAYVDGPNPPSTVEVVEALRISAVQGGWRPGQATAAAMACDIAATIGDGVMLQHCAQYLNVEAPGEPDTKRAFSLLASECPAPRFWLGWAAIFASLAVTLWHALSRRRWWRRASAALLFVLVLATPAVAHAQGAAERLSDWPIDDGHPERSIPSEKNRNAQPLQFGYWLQDLAAKAMHASKAGDHDAAVRYFKAMGLAVPDRAISYEKLCSEYQAMGDIDDAIGACGDALVRDGVTVGTYERFVRLVLEKPGNPTASEAKALAKVMDHMKSDPVGRSVVDELECEVGARTFNVAELRECTAALAARAPNDAKTIQYEWALAMAEGKLDAAEKIVARARSRGISIDNMQRATLTDVHERWWRRGLVVLAAALLFGAVAVVFRRRRPVSTDVATMAG